MHYPKNYIHMKSLLYIVYNTYINIEQQCLKVAKKKKKKNMIKKLLRMQKNFPWETFMTMGTGEKKNEYVVYAVLQRIYPGMFVQNLACKQLFSQEIMIKKYNGVTLEVTLR